MVAECVVCVLTGSFMRINIPWWIFFFSDIYIHVYNARIVISAGSNADKEINNSELTSRIRIRVQTAVIVQYTYSLKSDTEERATSRLSIK